MSPEPFVSRAKAPPAKRSEKGYGDENVPAFEEKHEKIEGCEQSKKNILMEGKQSAGT